MTSGIKKMRKEKKSRAEKLDQERSRNVFRQLAAGIDKTVTKKKNK